MRKDYFENRDINEFDTRLVPDYQFPVDIDEIGNATMLAEDNAMLFMRWIRKAIDNKTLKKL